MNRNLTIVVVIFAVIIALSIYFVNNKISHQYITTPTVNPTKINITTQTNTSISKPNITKTQNVTVNESAPSKPVCIEATNNIEPIFNGNFSTGTYAGWIVTNAGFGTHPLNITFLNKHNDYYGIPWNNYGNNTFMATTFEEGIAVAPGNLTSMPFKVTEPYLNFKLISPQNGEIYLEILENGTPKELAYFNTYAGPNGGPTTFENESIPLQDFLCKNVSVRVVFNIAGTTETNYVAVTGFYLSKTPRTAPNTVLLYKILNGS